MEPQELREIVSFLENRVTLDEAASSGKVAVRFAAPSPEEMVAAGLNAGGAAGVLAAPWWDEMVEEIVDTPGFCPGEPPETVLRYARDVVKEYIAKRFPL
jgi:hypothetical protein